MAAGSSPIAVLIGSALLYFLLLYTAALTTPYLSSINLKPSPNYTLPIPFSRQPHRIAKLRSAMESRGYSLAASTIADLLRDDAEWIGNDWPMQHHIERDLPITFLVPSDSSAAASDGSPRPVIGVLCGKLRRRDFDLANGTALPSCRRRLQGYTPDEVTVTRVEGGPDPEEDAARVADWSLYDDGRVVVHGIRGVFRERMAVVLPGASRRRGVVVGVSGEGVVVGREKWEKDARRWLMEKPADRSGCDVPPDGGWSDCYTRAYYRHTREVGQRDMNKEVLVF